MRANLAFWRPNILHTEYLKDQAKAKTDKLQIITNSKRYPKFNKKIHTLANLQKQIGDPSTSEEFESILPYDSRINEKN